MTLAQGLFKFLWNQSWIELKHKKAIYKKLCNYGDAPDTPFNKNFYGLQYQGNLNNSIEFHLYYLGAFEKPLLFFFRDTLQQLKKAEPQSTLQFFDVGANIEQHSLFMSQHAHQVHSFEPYQAVRQKLEHHIALNEIKNIRLHPMGLSNKKEQLDFYAPTGRNQGVGSFDASTVSKGNTVLGKLDLVCGDDYLQQEKLQDIALLKIDVEGFEKNVIEGLQATLAKTRPIIVVEVTYGNPLSFSSIDELLAKLPTDYALFRFDNRKADGSKARRRGAKAKRSGAYQLVTFEERRSDGQDDVIACPRERLELLPRQNSN